MTYRWTTMNGSRGADNNHRSLTDGSHPSQWIERVGAGKKRASQQTPYRSARERGGEP